MDWPSHQNPFLYPLSADAFKCILPAKDNLHCVVLEAGTDGEGRFKVKKRLLSTPESWEEWFKDKIFPKEKLITPSKLPKDGVRILFIPRAADVKPSVEANLTDLPISQENWDKIQEAFYLLPGHIVKAISRQLTSITSITRSFELKDDDDDSNSDSESREKLFMHIAMTSMLGPDTFALASTHFANARLTLAVMIGCSVHQMREVRCRLKDSEDAITHPLLMLGICAELQLKRLKKLVDAKIQKCLETTRGLLATRQIVTLDGMKNLPKWEITWDIINQVRESRDESKRAEEEVKATKRQLSKALPPALSSLSDQYENNVGNNNDGNNDNIGNNSSAASTSESEFDEHDEITNMFKERFADIFAQFEGLIANCRISVEEMSFTADIIRSELARQEAKTSGQEAKISTVIAFVAMLYLPMTTTATIFAMPIFQFTNDWRDWRFQPADKGNPSDLTSGANRGPNPPVCSGYFWIYLGISTAFTLITIEGWWRFTSREVERRKDKHWSLYLGLKTWKHMKGIKIPLPCSPAQQPTPTAENPPDQQIPDVNDDEQSGEESESEAAALIQRPQNPPAEQSSPPQQTPTAFQDIPSPPGASSSRSRDSGLVPGGRDNGQRLSPPSSGERTSVTTTRTGTKSKSGASSEGSSPRDPQQAASMDPAIIQEKEALNSKEGHENV